MSAARPPHLIAPDEVAAWLAESAVRTVTYHNTDRRSAEALLRSGARVDRSWNGSYGQGFYTTTVPDPFFGDVAVRAAVRLRQPLVGGFDEMGSRIDAIVRRLSPTERGITPFVARRIRQDLLRSGYDGIIVYDAGGDGVDYVIALVDDAVRVVVER